MPVGIALIIVVGELMTKFAWSAPLATPLVVVLALDRLRPGPAVGGSGPASVGGR